MWLRSDFRAAVTIKNRLHRESGEERAEPISFQQHQRWHPSSSSDSWWNRGHVQKPVGLVSSIHFLKLSVAVGFVCGWGLSYVSGGVCGQCASHVTFSHAVTRTHCCTSHCMAQECVGARHLIYMVIHVVHLSDCPFFESLFLVLFLSVCLFYPLLFSSHFHLDPDLNLFLHVDNAKTINHGASANWGVWPPGRIHPSHRLWAQAPWRLPLLGDYWNLLPGAIQRHDALVRAWRGTQWRDHRQSALFTTVHLGVRRTGGPKTSLSLFWSLLPAQSLSVCHSRTGRPVHELSSLSSRSREKPSRDSENERIRILLERQKRANSLWF